MKVNIDSGVVFNAAIIVKIKKMYNNIRKIYILNMYRAFLTIDKYGRNGVSDYSRDEYIPNPTDSILHDIDRPEPSQEVGNLVQVNRNVAISAMSRIFKKYVSKQVEAWQFNALPERKLEAINEKLADNLEDNYNYVAKIGAIENVSRLNSQITFKAKMKAFRLIAENMFSKKSELDQDESLRERLDLINRQNALMEEIRAYKEENEALGYEVENKDNKLREANETVTILSLRINYMITQKFLNMIEKVCENIQYRHYNDAFDALIE